MANTKERTQIRGKYNQYGKFSDNKLLILVTKHYIVVFIAF